MENNSTSRQSKWKHINLRESETFYHKNAQKLRPYNIAQNTYPLPHTKLIGIPTIEGMEFINTDKIIRCEGLQKCTQIVTTEKSDLISSYSIGRFVDLLKENGFFHCHRSHIINLQYVKKITKEGYIFFSVDSKPVPLARRKRCAFLKEIRHL